MILVCGIPSEEPVALVREALLDLDIPFQMINQREVISLDFHPEVTAEGVFGWCNAGGRSFSLAEVDGVYQRLMDDRFLPEIRDLPPNSPLRKKSRDLHRSIVNWCELTPARVVNRASAMASNFSKPYQLQLIRDRGFDVPETLVTNDPAKFLDFRKRHQSVIFKSVSSIRSIVRVFDDSDLPQLDRIRACPTQFQEFIDGTNIRVHVVGQQVFATEIRSSATDYRYAKLETDERSEMRAIDLPSPLECKCVDLASDLGLAFAGIDLKLDSSGTYYCFEVNPSPAYSFFESQTGQPISHAIATYLAGLPTGEDSAPV